MGLFRNLPFYTIKILIQYFIWNSHVPYWRRFDPRPFGILKTTYVKFIFYDSWRFK